MPDPRRANLTEGPIARTLVAFTLPILASSVLQSLNGSINAAWIGQLLGHQALTAAANANSLIFFLVGLAWFLIKRPLSKQKVVDTMDVMDDFNRAL